MLKLDNSLLQELGLGGLPEDQKKQMLQHIYETLELRVGTQLANQMTDAQLEEFERFIDQGGDQDQAEALKWLEANLPNYKQVVNDVFEALKAEISQMAPQIMSSAVPQPAPPMPQTFVQDNSAAVTPQMQSTYTTQPQQAYSPPQPAPQYYGAPSSQQPQYPQYSTQPQQAGPGPQDLTQGMSPTPPAQQPYMPAPSMPPAADPQQPGASAGPYMDPNWQPPQPPSNQ